MKKRNGIIGAVAIVLLAIGAWAFGLFGSTDPAVAELRKLGDQMFDRNLPDAQRDQLRTDFRQRIEAMSEDQRRAFFDANRDQWQQRGEQRMTEFFNLPKPEQTKRLDEIINQMLARQKEGQNSDRGRDAGGRGRGGWGNMTEAQRDERSKRRLDNSSPQIRAQFTEFRRRLDQRATQRGVDPSKLPGWGFGGGRG